jgi:hypothetical protein
MTEEQKHKILDDLRTMITNEDFGEVKDTERTFNQIAYNALETLEAIYQNQ